MKGRLGLTLHPQLFMRYNQVCAKGQKSKTVENLIRMYNEDPVITTKRYKSVRFSVFTIYTIDSEVLNEFLTGLSRDKASTIVGLLIKQWLEGLKEL